MKPTTHNVTAYQGVSCTFGVSIAIDGQTPDLDGSRAKLQVRKTPDSPALLTVEGHLTPGPSTDPIYLTAPGHFTVDIPYRLITTPGAYQYDLLLILANGRRLLPVLGSFTIKPTVTDE